MEETIGRNVNVSVGEFNLCVLGVPYILAGCDLQGYVLSYCSLVKKSLFFKVPFTNNESEIVNINTEAI